MGNTEQLLLDSIKTQGALFAVLLDPDSEKPEQIIQSGIDASNGGADLLLIGSSFMGNPHLTTIAKELKKNTALPVILFPGAASQVNAGPDAILFTVLVSGRNPQYLIDEQVRGALQVKQHGIEPIPTAYILVESGKTTAVEYISNTRPIPADKAGIAAVHALAAQMMGQRWVYLEAGSGAQNPIPSSFIQSVRKLTDLHVITGGGIRTPETARERVSAGAHIVVIGNHFESAKAASGYKEFADAIHNA